MLITLVLMGKYLESAVSLGLLFRIKNQSKN